MPCRYEIDRPAGVVRVRLYGDVTDEDLLDADLELRADSGFDPKLDEIVDTSDGGEAKVTPNGIRELVKRPPLFAPSSRRAIVVGTDLGFGLARIFQARRGDHAGEIRVFRTLSEAEVWLSGDSAPS
jgi:hypothetical protein